MAWYLNEALTDLSVFPGVLPVLGSQPRDAVYKYLRSPRLNLDLLDDRVIPKEYVGKVYRWLEADLRVLCQNLGFIRPQAAADTPAELTPLGSALADESVTLEGALAGGLFQWRFDSHTDSVPMLSILEALETLEGKRPCGGLMLPEFIRVMRQLERGDSVDNCMAEVLRRRETVEVGDAEMEVRKRVCELYLPELSRLDVARGRATQVNILSSGLVAYGGLLDEVQYMKLELDQEPWIRLNRPYREAIQILRDMEPLEMAKTLDEIA